MSKYIKGNKVVMEITDRFKNAYGHEYCSVLDSLYSADFIDEKTEPLTAYTEPLEAKIKRQAAEITRLLEENKELKEQMKFDLPTLISEEDRRRMDINKARAEGAEAAWELARKIYLLQEFGGYSADELVKIFGTASIGEIFRYTYSEAAAKASQWEKAKEEIKVGDIVRLQEGSDNDLCILCKTSDEKYYNAVDKYGALYPLLTKEHFSKTGRHIDIDSFLKQIGEEGDEK